MSVSAAAVAPDLDWSYHLSRKKTSAKWSFAEKHTIRAGQSSIAACTTSHDADHDGPDDDAGMAPASSPKITRSTSSSNGGARDAVFTYTVRPGTSEPAFLEIVAKRVGPTEDTVWAKFAHGVSFSATASMKP